MTFDEVRTILENAAWAHETPLVELFDELVEHHDQPQERKRIDGTSENTPGCVTATCTGLIQPGLASGQVVAWVLSLRQECGLEIYERGVRLDWKSA